MIRITCLLLVAVALVGCGGQAAPDSGAIAQAVQATLTAMPASRPQAAEVTRVVDVTRVIEATRVVEVTRASTDTPAPTDTPFPTETFTPVPKPVLLEGTGQTATGEFVLPSPVSVARFTHNGQRNFIVQVYQGGEKDLLVNTVGAYRGNRLLMGNEPVTLDISADGAWTVEVQPIGTTDSPKFNGTGDDVSGLFTPPATGAWEIQHTGKRNFIVHLRCSGESDLIQNVVGPVSGSRMVQFPTGPCLWEVTADGEWSLTPRQ